METKDVTPASELKCNTMAFLQCIANTATVLQDACTHHDLQRIISSMRVCVLALNEVYDRSQKSYDEYMIQHSIERSLQSLLSSKFRKEEDEEIISKTVEYINNLEDVKCANNAVTFIYNLVKQHAIEAISKEMAEKDGNEPKPNKDN